METKAEQFYPTYKSKERDVLLIEFEEAQKIANGQTKVYGQVTNVTLAISTFLFSLFLGSENDNATALLESNKVFFAVILIIFGGILLRYFVDLQKQITINARKVVTLRTLLGLDYGHIHLTLPNWRVEGATNPFVIKYFNGWFRFETMPFWVLTIFVNSIWYLATREIQPWTIDIDQYFYVSFNYSIGFVLISALYIWIFRLHLHDLHETFLLNVVKNSSYLLRIKLMDNFEYVLPSQVSILRARQAKS
jgi:penicillin-binding protein 1A